MYRIHMPFVLLEAVNFVAYFTFSRVMCRIDVNFQILFIT